MDDTSPVVTPVVKTVSAVSKAPHVKMHTKVFNNHSDKTAQVKVIRNGINDYITVMPRSRVDLPSGTLVHAEEFKNPNLRIV